MLTIPFIISNILTAATSAAVSAGVTVYLLRYFFLVHREEIFGQAGVQKIKSEPAQTVLMPGAVAEGKHDSAGAVEIPNQISTEESILNSFKTSDKKNNFSIFYSGLKSFKTIFNWFGELHASLNYAEHYIAHSLSSFLDAILDFVFSVAAAVLGVFLVPFYKLFFKVSKFSFDLSFSKLGAKIMAKYRAWLLALNANNKNKNLVVFEEIEELSKESILKIEEEVVLLENKAEEKFLKIIDKEINPRFRALSFANEMFLSATLMVLTALPFAFGLQSTNSGLVLLYCLVLLALGAYALLYRGSSRVFWATGIVMWGALAMWYFTDKGGFDLGSVIIFLCAFLSIYAVASFIWYGIKGKDFSFIEYGLFVLHPFLYLAGIYLLLAKDAKAMVVLLCAAVASLYIVFAAEAKKQKLAKPDFIYITELVALVAMLSMVCVATTGFVTVAILIALILIYLARAKSPKTSYIIILLLVLFGQTLEVSNLEASYSFLANERFISYLASAGLFTYVASMRKIGKSVVSNNVKLLSNLALAATTFFGLTIEILDAKVNSTIFAKGTPGIILGLIYILIGVFLFLKAQKEKSIVLKLAAVFFAIYTLYFISTKLLG